MILIVNNRRKSWGLYISKLGSSKASSKQHNRNQCNEIKENGGFKLHRKHTQPKNHKTSCDSTTKAQSNKVAYFKEQNQLIKMKPEEFKAQNIAGAK